MSNFNACSASSSRGTAPKNSQPERSSITPKANQRTANKARPAVPVSKTAAGALTPKLAVSQASAGRLLTVKSFCQCHAWPPEGGLRYLIFFAKTNGFDKVIRRVGRRVLIDESAFFSWVNGQGSAE